MFCICFCRNAERPVRNVSLADVFMSLKSAERYKLAETPLNDSNDSLDHQKNKMRRDNLADSPALHFGFPPDTWDFPDT